MTSKARTTLVAMTAAIVVFLLGAAIAGGNTAYADVGSIAVGEDVSYDKNGGMLSSMGFDTSKTPEDYDPDATTNPYGSDVSTLDEVDEIVLFDVPPERSSANPPSTYLFGHDNKLNGSYEDFVSTCEGKQRIGFLSSQCFFDAVKCDITGDGRDSALAVVYTEYNGFQYNDKFAIYMRLYDPVSRRYSDAFEIGHFRTELAPRIKLNFHVQSQIQITAGDYDKDSIDEIAVYAPARDASERNIIQIYDLVDGKDCEDPFDKASWQRSWNYMLPNTNETVVMTDPGGFAHAQNCYNNIDLASGDADNDGICDLIVSYGASDTDYYLGGQHYGDSIARSVPSKSVLLYGSDDGQMLRDSQPISYGGNSLIRVSFAFGDVDADGNEDMFIAGQLQAEQSENISRVLGKYVYDQDTREMALESMQNLKVVDGTWEDSNEDGTVDKFYSSNGWDDRYYSVPLMKTNLAIGKIFGDDSNTKIYLDSVLYSYDNGNYQIEDELEDDSTNEDGSKKGSCIFAGEKALIAYDNVKSCYFEFGADCANFTASPSDYVMVSRVSVQTARKSGKIENLQASSSILYLNNKNELTRKDPANSSSGWQGTSLGNEYYGAPLLAVTVDTDKDGLIADYTGEHNIQYQDPTVLAVLASPPYFRDVAAYDENNMLPFCTTEYGSSSGSAHGHEETYQGTVGAFFNTKFGAANAHAIASVAAGYARSETWGWERERVFEMSYKTEAGEDSVVMYSVPTENYVYKVHGVTVDDDGNCEQFTNTMVVTKPHKPVTQTLTLEDYNEIQAQYPDELPDVTKYLTSTPGDPSSYPTSEKDISDEAKSHIDKDTNYPIDYGEKWVGNAFGTGSTTQTLSYSESKRDRYKNHMDGGFGSIKVGFGTETKLFVFKGLEVGASYDFSQMHGYTNASLSGADCSATIKNMPRSAKGYGYDFSWKIFKYNIKDKGCTFPVVTYIVNDVSMPPALPDTIEQDFDNTSDSQIALTWTYNSGNPQAFEIYRYKDFPIGGGDELIATIAGGDYKIMKDEDGNTLRDKDGRVVRGYSFVDVGLTADTKYQYRLKVRTAKLPGESIFSPVVEARTAVGTKPDLSLSTDDLTIYPDSTYNVKVILADPEHYQMNANNQPDMSYQWQKYDAKKRKWEDIEGCDKQVLHFFRCSPDDAGSYRCRVNLIRKVESNPQHISAFTGSCDVSYSLRSVKFGPIQVFEGEGDSQTNTGLFVNLSNTSQASREKPTGVVTFDITGPNGTFQVASYVDEATGDVTIDSIEDLIEALGQKDFVDGGYLITASYGGNAIFYPANDEEEFHYLRNIDESVFLSLKSSYYFGEDLAETMGLYDYRISPGGVKRTDFTGRISKIAFYQVGDDGISKTGNVVDAYEVSGDAVEIPVPLNKKLAKRAYVEAYMDGGEEPVASQVIVTRKIPVLMDVKDKTTGTGSLCDFLSCEDDVELSNGLDPREKNIETNGANKSLADFMLIRYYEQNGDFICSSDDTGGYVAEFIPASYRATVELREDSDAFWFYNPVYRDGRFMVVGNYYLVSAGPKDTTTGRVRMISPDDRTNFVYEGYIGGTKIVLKAEPNPGYKIDKWIVDDCGNTTMYPGTERFTFTVRSQNTDGDGIVSIVAQMTPKDNRISITPVGNGWIEAVPSVSNGDYVLAGTKLAFTAIPDLEHGWHFAEWRFNTLGGTNIVSPGTPNGFGSNTKEFTMPDSSAEVYALFARDTVDVVVSDSLEVLFENNGGDPYHEVGEMVQTEKGRNVPKGVAVTVRTKPGFALASDAQWAVTVANEQGEVPVEVTETMSQGKRACTFTLPEDAALCAVSTQTVTGKYAVAAETTGVQFTISVDGKEMGGTSVSGIAGGSQVDIKAKPERGRRLTGWVINGETKKTSDTIYTCNIDENMSVAVTTEPIDAFSMSMAAEGGGTLKYTIGNAEGEELETGYVGEDGLGPVPVYPEESVLFQKEDENNEYTLTSISVNGVQQELDEGTFAIASVDGDIDILATFSPNIYFDATFTTDFRSEGVLLFDAYGDEIADGEALRAPKNRELMFSVVVSNERGCFAYAGGRELTSENEPFDQNRTRYKFKVKLISNMGIVVADHAIREIRSSDELVSYLADLASAVSSGRPYNQPDGVLKADIDMTGVGLVPASDMYAHFDGGGCTVSNLTLGTAQNRVDGFRGIFGTLHEEAELKDVVFDTVAVYAEAHSDGCGLLAQNNYGTISGVSIQNATLDTTHSTDSNTQAGGLAFDNLGVIEHCKVSNLTLVTDKDRGEAGSALVAFNQRAQSAHAASMTGNYVVNLYRQESDEDGPVSAAFYIVASGDSYGSFASNYFWQPEDDPVDSNGISVYDLVTGPGEVGTAAFSRKLAYTMNKGIGEDVWGVAGNGEADTDINQLSRKGGGLFAPFKVEFVAAGKKVDKYFVPGEIVLLAQADFGASTPRAWEIGDRAYSPGATVEIQGELRITGVANFEEYVATLSEVGEDGEELGVVYYKDFNDVIRDAAQREGQVDLVSHIIGEATLSGTAQSVGPRTRVVVDAGATLKISKDLQVNNKGTLVVESGATVHKYGSLMNEGSLTINEGAEFINYGSALVNRGTVSGKDFITCRPHIYDRWVYEDAPDEDGVWAMTGVCSVCGHEDEEPTEVAPNPDASEVKDVEIMTAPDTTSYAVGDAFTDEGLLVIANLKDGTKAAITSYALAIRIGDAEEKAIANGDALNDEGEGKVVVRYGGFAADYDVEVKSFAGLSDAIAAAQAAVGAISVSDDGVVSDDGADLPAGTEYVTPAAKQAFVDAIAAAQEVLDNPKSTRSQIAAALQALEDARQAFDAARQTSAAGNPDEGGSGGESGGDSGGGSGAIEEPVDNAGPGATEGQIEAFLASFASDSDPAGSEFSKLRLNGKKAGKKSITLKWAKVNDAERYLLFGNKRGKKNGYQKIASVAKNSYKVKKVAGKKLKKATYYKFIVVALDSAGKVISTSKVAHVATKGGKYANPKKVKVKVKSKIKIQASKSKKLKAKQVNPATGKVKKCRKLRYESTDASIATVSKSGKVKGVAAGKCIVYAYAQNGVAKKVTVTVKGSSVGLAPASTS